jgi:hypothetical protein
VLQKVALKERGRTDRYLAMGIRKDLKEKEMEL